MNENCIDDMFKAIHSLSLLGRLDAINEKKVTNWLVQDSVGFIYYMKTRYTGGFIITDYDVLDTMVGLVINKMLHGSGNITLHWL